MIDDIFSPMLLKVDVTADIIDPGEVLWVTVWWQNAGKETSRKHLKAFMNMDFGHQRIVETRQRHYSVHWEPYPQVHNWKPGEIWATTCRMQIPEIWGGSYEIFLGLCDDENTPVNHIGTDGRYEKRTYLGELDIGWGWGRPEVKKQSKPWKKEFNPPLRVKENAEREIQNVGGENQNDKESVSIGDDIKAGLRTDCPVLARYVQDCNIFDNQHLLPEIILRDRSRDVLIYSYEAEINVTYQISEQSVTNVSYKTTIFLYGQEVAGCKICFNMVAEKLNISVCDVWEKEGFELLEVIMPSLVTSKSPDTKIASFFGGGREINIIDCRPIGYEHAYDVRGTAAIYNEQVMAIVESASLDNKISIKVEENSDGKRAVLGASIVMRVKARGNVPSIPIKGNPGITVDFSDESWGKPSWQAAARFWRKGIAGRNRDIYRRALLYKYSLSYGPYPDASMISENMPYSVSRLTKNRTFSDAEDIVRKFCYITDGAPQVFYMVGWQYQGHDTGYPYVFDVNASVGIKEELEGLIKRGKEYNAIISMHDNYDDAYFSPYYDPEIISADEWGKPYKGWIWTGGLSTIISPVKYYEQGKMAERVHKTIENFGVKKSYHLDVLSSEVRRYDFDSNRPSAADECMTYRKRTVDEFNKYGIDITSETLTHPFVGSIGFAYSTRDDYGADQLFTGEKYKPITSMVYHGFIQYNGGDTSNNGILNGIVTGAYMKLGDLEENISVREVRAFYQQSLPMGLLYDETIEDVYEDEEDMVITYSNNGCVRLNKRNNSYEIIVAGRKIAYNWSTFAPGFKEGSYLAYSVKETTLCYPLPEEWKGCNEFKAVILTFEGEGGRMPCRRDGESILLDIPADTPIRVVPEFTENN
jgi:hypothetical protein